MSKPMIRHSIPILAALLLAAALSACRPGKPAAPAPAWPASSSQQPDAPAPDDEGRGGSRDRSVGIPTPNFPTLLNLPVIDIRKYGAKGDGVNDDTEEIQAAATDAIAVQGKLLFPPPPVFWNITSTINLLPVSGGQFRLDMEGAGYFGSIKYTGPPNGTVFKAMGWKGSTIRKMQVGTNLPGVIIWDLDANATYPSLTDLTFETCFVDIANGGRSVAWRKNASGGNYDISDIVWINCRVVGSGSAGGDIAFQNLSQNGLHYQWFGGFVGSCFNLARCIGGYSNLNGAINNTVTTITVTSTLGFPPAGRVRIVSAGGTEDVDYTGVTSTQFTGVTRGVNGTTAVAHGNGFGVTQLYAGNTTRLGGTSHSFFGMGASGNATDLFVNDSGTVGVWGGRWEDGGCFLQAGLGGGVTPVSVKLDNVRIADYNPADGKLFKLWHAVDLLLDNCSVNKAVPFTSNMIDTTGSGATARGVVAIRAGAYSAAWPPYTATGNNWRFTEVDALQLSDGSTVVGRFPTGEAVTYTTPYAPRPFFMGRLKTMTLAGPLTVSAPLGTPVVGDVLEFAFKQDATGGRVVTWDAAYEVDWTPDTAANVSNGIAFRYNGTKWAQTGVKTLGIPKVVGLQAALDGKASTSATWTLAQITDEGTAASRNTGTTNGTVPLIGTDNLLPTSIIPATAGTKTWVVADETEMLALSAAVPGNFALQTDPDVGDPNQLFVLAAAPPSVLANWEGPIATGVSVTSVNGQTGIVSLTTANVTENTNQYFTPQRAVDALAGHTHDDRYFTEAEADARFSAVAHNHDSRYYTEAETDTLLSGKSATGHIHTSLDVTDFTSAVDAVVTPDLALKANLAGGNTFTGLQTISIANGFPAIFKPEAAASVGNLTTWKDETGAIVASVDDNGQFSGTLFSGTFSGSGTALTALNASELASGTVAAARLPAATDAASGAVELATNAETVTGTDAVRATTPAGVAAAIAAGGGGVDFSAKMRQTADVTVATTTPTAATGLVFTYAANTRYELEYFVQCTSAAATTGYAFTIDTSTAVGTEGLDLTFDHGLASTGTRTGGYSIGDNGATVIGVSSGVPVAGQAVMVRVNAKFHSGGTGGTAQLMFRPELAASATIKAGSTGRAMVIP